MITRSVFAGFLRTGQILVGNDRNRWFRVEAANMQSNGTVNITTREIRDGRLSGFDNCYNVSADRIVTLVDDFERRLNEMEAEEAAIDAEIRAEADMEARAEHDAYLRRCESLGFRDGSWDGEVDGEAAAEWAAMRAMEDAAEIYDLRHGY